MTLDSRIQSPPVASQDAISISIDPPTPVSALTRPHIHQHPQQHDLHPICTADLRLHNDVSDKDHRNEDLDSFSPDSAITQTTPTYENTKETVDPSSSSFTFPPSPNEFHTEDDDRLHRHPLKVRSSLYTRFFRLDQPETRSSAIVRSSWLPTGALFLIRFILFVYAFTVLATDIHMTDRPRYEFCYLTQLSYLGLTSYLGTVSWHTFSEWRRERALWRILKNRDIAQLEAVVGSGNWTEMPMPKTTIERQYWWLTDMNFFLYHTICTFHIIVPLLYWGYLGYEGDAHSMALEMAPDSLWRNYSFHGGDLIIVLLEFLINAMPFIPSHVVIVFAICLLYLAEAHIVYHVDGFWIYPFLDTTGGPIWMALYVGVGIVILCAFSFMYFLHRGRNWIRTKSQQDLAIAVSGLQDQQQQQQQQGSGGQEEMEAVDGSNAMAQQSTNNSTTPSQIYYLYQARLMAHVQTQSRKRSCSNSSDDSTASTLVGSDEGMSKKLTRKSSDVRAAEEDSSTTNDGVEQQQQQQQQRQQQRQQQLEKVEEASESDNDNDNDAKNKHHHEDPSHHPRP